MTDELLKLNDITVEFSIQTSLFKTILVRPIDKITFSVNKGETLALVGESGCGKTTLGRVTLKLVPVKSGNIFFDGKEITYLKESELSWFRSQAQMVFQDPYSSIDPYMSIREILEEPLKINGISERQHLVSFALESVRLSPTTDYLTKFPHMLSGGQRQRLGIARALILRPRYLFADEPVSMIDASSRTEILGLLSTLKTERDLSCLYVTHDIATVRHFADRVAVMYLGQLVEIGSPSQIIDRPFHPYTKALIASVPEPHPSNKNKFRNVVQGEPPSLTRIPMGCPFHPRCPEAIPGQCNVIKPVLKLDANNRQIACHLYNPK